MRAVHAPGAIEADAAGLPARAGVGFKAEHFADIARSRQGIGFFEVHAENFMGAGGPPHAQLAHIRRDYPLSLHGVGLSIGGDGPLDRAHLARLEQLVDRYEPARFSEHLAWSTHGGAFFNDLLPLPYDAQTLARVCAHVLEVQEALGRRILLENPATYVEFAASTYSEIDFLTEIVTRAGCGLLLDVNNVYVCAVNHGFAAQDYIDAFPIEHVEEIHLAGFAEDVDDADMDDIRARLLIDAHGAPVSDPVWALYERALERRGPVATLIEWDNDLPGWPVLLAQARRAEAFLHNTSAARKTAHGTRSGAAA